MANPYSNIWLAVLQTKGVVDLPERIPVTATTLINSLKNVIYKKCKNGASFT